jgi:flavin reductase ActVB
MALRVEDYTAVSLDGTVYTLAPGEVGTGAVEPYDEAVADAFRASMRLLAAGVVMVTTRVHEKPWGLTISSCCSISLEPPRLLVSLHRRTASCQAIVADGRFGVDVLSANQGALARHGAAPGAPKFIDEHCEDGTEQSLSPMILGALCHLDCVVAEVFDGGDHAVILGAVHRVVHGKHAKRLRPLLYFDGSFHRLGSRTEN